MQRNEISKKLGLTGISLCAICCALPIIGASIGVGALTAVAFYLEKIGILLIGTGIIFFLYFKFKKERTAPSCSTDCNCKEEAVNSNQ
jgi:arginine exporter protein ArgO